MEGLFITFEGIEGSGKTTQIRKLVHALNQEGLFPVVTREPGGTPIGEEIRKIILDRKHHRMEPKTELLLYLSSRAQHLAEVILPQLENGQIIISDRFSDATLAYQGYGRDRDIGKLKEFIALILDAKEPHLTFLLDMDVFTGLSRIRKRGSLNRLDQEDLDFHQRVREGYLQLAKENSRRIQILSGEKDPDALHQEIMQILAPLLTGYRPSEGGFRKGI